MAEIPDGIGVGKMTSSALVGSMLLDQLATADHAPVPCPASQVRVAPRAAEGAKPTAAAAAAAAAEHRIYRAPSQDGRGGSATRR